MDEVKRENLPIIERIQGKFLKNVSPDLRSAILLDTTPVPFFGDFIQSEIVSIGLNPSSNEFPANKSNRRLVHLSDLELPENYYQKGLDFMSESQAAKVLEHCVNYFESNSYKWFNTASVALHIGFGASYYKSRENSLSACHTDIFPWATRAYSSLDSNLKSLFKSENKEFLNWFLQRDKVKHLVILGKSTWKELEALISFNPIHKELVNSAQKTTFEYGVFEINGIQKKYVYSSKGPSARGTDAEKHKVHELFGRFIESSLKTFA